MGVQGKLGKERSPTHAGCRRDRPIGQRASYRGLADDLTLGCGDLVEPAHGRGVRRALRDLGILDGLCEYRGDRVSEGVERLPGLGLGRLDHQRLLHQQREVHGGRVKAEVEQPLGEVQGLDLQLALHRRAREHELVHAQIAVGQRQVVGGAAPVAEVVLLKAREQVVGVQHRGLGGVLQPVGAERADVGVRTYEAAVVALEAAQATDRLGPRQRLSVIEVEAAVVAPDDQRQR